MQQATGLVVLGSVDLQDQEGDRDGEDTVAERRSPGGVGQTGLILQGVLDRVLVRHDRMLALGMRRHGWATWRWKGDPHRPHPPADAARALPPRVRIEGLTAPRPVPRPGGRLRWA